MAIDVTTLQRSSNTNKKKQLIRQKRLLYVAISIFYICATITLND